MSLSALLMDDLSMCTYYSEFCPVPAPKDTWGGFVITLLRRFLSSAPTQPLTDFRISEIIHLDRTCHHGVECSPYSVRARKDP